MSDTADPKTPIEAAQPAKANVVASPAPGSSPAPESSPALEQPIPANVWAYGDHERQVPLAGALADDPSLREAFLTPDQWRQRVDAYLAKPA